MTTKLRYIGKAFVRGWKTGEEREVSDAEARQFNTPRAKALGFRIAKKKENVSIKSILKGGKNE